MYTQKIHFINRIADDNAGDVVCSPLWYYYDFFKDYNIIRHDIDSINWIEISSHDVVIVGGGGMLYVTESFNENLNRLLDICPTVIAWGVGFNTHHDNPILTPIDTNRFKLIGIRDYAHSSGLDYLPCVSCNAIELDNNLELRRRIGIIDHRYVPVSHDIPGERIDNGENFRSITDFIASSEIIMSSSYHVVFWATLMNKKVICANAFSTKFDYFKYKPVFCSGDLEFDIAKTKVFPNALQEARNLNNDFFEKVKKIIQMVIPSADKRYQYIYDMTFPAFNRREIHGLKAEYYGWDTKDDVALLCEDVALLCEKWSIYWQYYRYKILSMFTFGKKRKHYKAKRDSFHLKVRKIRELYKRIRVS